MPDDDKSEAPEDRRREKRHSPYPYLPHAVINPDDSENRLTGFVRNQSRNGFSAQFEVNFPFQPGDIVDVRVGYQRAWAEVAWVEKLLDQLCIVGFRLHPQEFLKRLNTDSPGG